MNKLIAAIAISISGITLFSSCNKLDENPKGVLTEINFYKTQNDAIAAVTSVYSTLTTDVLNDFPLYGRQLNLIVDNPSDNQVYSPSNTNPDVRALGTATYVSANGRIQKIYAQLYWGINKANIAIDKIATIPASAFQNPANPQANLINEAKFIRALDYFNLVRLFGPVSLVLHDVSSLSPSAVNIPRSSRDSVYAQIISDLTDATALPVSNTGSNVGRVTSGAAHALLAKVYVTRQNWAAAKVELEKVITAGTAGFTNTTTGNYGYDLFANFKDAFQSATKNGKEHIFSAQFNGTSGGFTSTNTLSSFSWTTSQFLADQPADSTVVENVFSLNDERRSATFYDSLYNTTTNATAYWGKAASGKHNNYQFFKFVDQSKGYGSALQTTQAANSTINFPVIRYSDVLLLYAEVLSQLNGGPTADAVNALNIVRGRAYNPVTNLVRNGDYSSYNYTGNGNYKDHSFDLTVGQFSSETQFLDTVFTERRREFIQEAQRWFDLVRRTDYGPGQYYLKSIQSMYNYGKPTYKTGVTLRDTIFPIPDVELQSNPNIKQNAGW